MSSEKSRSTRLSNNAVDCSSDGGAVREIWWVFRALHLSARPVLGAYGHHHQKCQKIVRASESSRKSRRTRLSKKFVDCSSDGAVVREIWWVFRACGRLSAMPVLGAYGHHHQNCQKIVRASESSRKSRRTRLSKKFVDCSSDGGAVREIWWVFCALHLSARPVLGAYGHHHQKCQKIVRTSESS